MAGRKPTGLVSSGPCEQDDGHAHAFSAVCLLCGATAQECGYVFHRVVISTPPARKATPEAR